VRKKYVLEGREEGRNRRVQPLAISPKRNNNNGRGDAKALATEVQPPGEKSELMAILTLFVSTHRRCGEKLCD